MHHDRIASLHAQYNMSPLPIKVGQMLEVHENVGEGDSKRVWRFTGLVLSVKNPNTATGTFVMRGEVAGVVIEKTYPLCFPYFAKIIVMNQFFVKKSKIYYMRNKVGKSARLKSLIHQNDRGFQLHPAV